MPARLLTFALALAFLASTLHAAPPDVVDGGKKATALVRVTSKRKSVGYGSAFCIDSSGLFVTNAHVADAAGRDLELVVESGGASQRIIATRVVRIDKALDLVLLQALQPGPYTALPLGTADALQETAEIMAFGYPFGNAMALDHNGSPAVSVNTGRVTSLRKKDGELELIQVDASLNPGNSGGPVLNSEGQVVGIVKAGIPGAGVNFAIPVNRLNSLLKAPLLSVVPTALPFENWAKPQRITVKMVSLQRPPPAYTVELTLLVGDAVPHMLSGTCRDGVCVFDVPPTVVREAPRELPVILSFPDGKIIGKCLDRQFHVGDEALKLTTVQRIEFQPGGGAVVTVGQRTLTGLLKGLDDFTITLGAAPFKPDLPKARTMLVGSFDQPAASAEYSITVKLENEVVAQATGIISESAEVLWEQIRSGLAASRTTETRDHGGSFSMKTPYSDIPPEGGVLMGFNYDLGKFMDRSILNSIQPIYQTARGELLGQIHGTPTGPMAQVRRKSGYAVTGLRIRGGGNLDSLRLIYTRLLASALDPEDTYQSPWIGMPEGNRDEVLESEGGVVVGISGKQSEKIGSIALVFLPMNVLAAGTPYNPIAEVLADGKYGSFEQMFETVPPAQQPQDGRWTVAPTLSPELSGRLKDKPALMTAEFASVREDTTRKVMEVTLDTGVVNYRGFKCTGQIIARFPLDQAAKLKALKPRDRLTISGAIDAIVVRGNPNNKAFVWLNDCQLN